MGPYTLAELLAMLDEWPEQRGMSCADLRPKDIIANRLRWLARALYNQALAERMKRELDLDEKGNPL